VEYIESFFKFFYNIPELIRIGGLYGLILVIFSETGLMVGFFLPGDSLLLTAGLFAARGDLNIETLIPCLLVAAICGNTTGYWIGNRAGRALYSRPNSFLFRREHLMRAHEFYERHGGMAITLAQFMPFFRTFTPVVAGAAEMSYRRFFTFNVIGAVVWITSMLLAGFYLGRIVPDIEHRIHLVIAGVIFVSLLPALYAWLKSRRQGARAA
jgi:membrane-associated protein